MDPRDYETSRLGRLTVFLVVTFIVTTLAGGGEPTAAPSKAAAPVAPAR